MIHDGDGDDGGVGQMASRSRHKRGHDDTDVIVMLPFILLYSINRGSFCGDGSPYIVDPSTTNRSASSLPIISSAFSCKIILIH